MPNFNDDDYSDNEVSEVAKKSDSSRPQDNSATPAPSKVTTKKRKGDRVNRDRKVPPPKKTSAKPKVKEQ